MIVSETSPQTQVGPFIVHKREDAPSNLLHTPTRTLAAEPPKPPRVHTILHIEKPEAPQPKATPQIVFNVMPNPEYRP